MPSSHCSTLRLRYVKYKGMVCVLGEKVDKKYHKRQRSKKQLLTFPDATSYLAKSSI